MRSGWLVDLFEKQNKLDTYIKETKVDREFNVNDIVNAFLIEAGEFLNEVRAFKYWSNKEMEYEKAYEEFVDGLHFILSIGNHFWGLEKMAIISSTLENRLENIEQGELNLYIDKKCDYKDRFVTRSIQLFTSSAYLNGTLEEYMDYVVSFIRLGFNVGMDIEMMIEEYNKKHETNYIRQRNGY